MKRNVQIVGAIAAVALLGGVMANLAGLFEDKIATDVTATAMAAAPSGPVLVVETRAEPVIEMAVGTVQPKDETVVSSRLTARITSIGVRAGDAVAKGDEIVRLDDRDLTARVEQQHEAVQAARATRDEAQAGFRRIKTLHDRGTASSADLDRVEAGLRTARAELARAINAEEEALATLSYSILRAPLSGRVIERFADPGDTATTGAALVRLYDPRLLRLEAHVRESLAVRMTRGDALHAHIDALDRTVPVSVDEVVPSGDPGSRTFVVKLKLPEDLDLYPGMFGRVHIETGIVERIYVPATSISSFGQLEFVSVETPEGTVRRFVRTGRRSNDAHVEILSGLAAGERVVLAAN